MKIIVISISLSLFALMLSTNSFAQGGQKWSLNGNSASASNFLGTTNASPLIFKTNSTERLTFD